MDWQKNTNKGCCVTHMLAPNTLNKPSMEVFTKSRRLLQGGPVTSYNWVLILYPHPFRVVTPFIMIIGQPTLIAVSHIFLFAPVHLDSLPTTSSWPVVPSIAGVIFEDGILI